MFLSEKLKTTFFGINIPSTKTISYTTFAKFQNICCLVMCNIDNHTISLLQKFTICIQNFSFSEYAVFQYI